MTPKNWTLNTYTVDSWTPVVGEPAILATILLSNSAAAPVTVSIRLIDGATERAIVLPPSILQSDSAYALELRSLCLTGAQAVELRASAAGVHAVISGVV